MKYSVLLEGRTHQVFAKAAMIVKKKYNLTEQEQIQSIVEKENNFVIRSEPDGWDKIFYADFESQQAYTMFCLRWA